LIYDLHRKGKKVISIPVLLSAKMFLLLALIFTVIIVVKIIVAYDDFSHELKYLNLEINRTRGKERKRWKKRKRRLLRSLLPFFKY